MNAVPPQIRPIQWENDALLLLDQRKLPLEEIYVRCTDYKAVADAIRTMVVRGAPAIGVAAAMGMALGAMGIGVDHFLPFMERLGRIGDTLCATRPTAVNLRWAVERMLVTARQHEGQPIPVIVTRLRQEALATYQEDLATNRQLGRHSATLIADGDHLLTHCNAGILATAGYGTALAGIYHAHAAGHRLHVYVDETRPFLQGARLTAWELTKYEVPATLITDNMAGWLMQQGRIQKIFVGADRIAANGDTANKIGTYGLAVLAKHHGLPFYVVAPRSTIDLTTPDGTSIPIEERDPREVTHIAHMQVSPPGIAVYNPAFDITPALLITAIVTEQGILRPPFISTLA